MSKGDKKKTTLSAILLQQDNEEELKAGNHKFRNYNSNYDKRKNQ